MMRNLILATFEAISLIYFFNFQLLISKVSTVTFINGVLIKGSSMEYIWLTR
jgi:hypothetical protein